MGGFVVGLYLLTNLLNQVVAFCAADPLLFLSGLQPPSYYLEANLGSYGRVAAFISQKLPADAQIVSWLEPRSYYFNRFTRPDFHLDEYFYYMQQYSTPDQLAAALKARGATHVLLSEHGLDFMLNIAEYNRVADVKAAQPLLEAFKVQHLTLLYEEPGEYAVYGLH
jgi:hypothetical protein